MRGYIITDWKNCCVEGCSNKVCMALNSDKCFPHTKGNRHLKLFKIWLRNLLINFGR